MAEPERLVTQRPGRDSPGRALSPEAAIVTGDEAMRRNDALAALAAYDMALALGATADAAWAGAAAARLLAGRSERALQILDGYCMIGCETTAMLLVRAAACFSLGRRSATTCALDLASEGAPGDPEPWLDRARYLVAWGCLDDARSAIDHAVELAPASVDARLLAADLEWYGGRPDLALERSLVADHLWASSTTAHAVGHNLLRMGRLTQAAHWFETSIERDSEWWEAWCNLGISQYRLRDWWRALTAFRRAFVLFPLNPSVQTGLIKTLFRVLHVREAWRVQAECLRLDREADRLSRVLRVGKAEGTSA